jgi:nucleoside-diphosphate-sugar epimerase
MTTDNTQLILGFTGGIGRAVALALSKRKIPIKALVRNKEKAEKYAKGINNIQLIEGDAGNDDDVKQVMKGVSVVYYCVNIPYPQWEEKALKLFYTCMSKAVKSKVKLIFPGNVYVYGHAKYNPVNEKHPHAAHTKKGQIRMEMEEMMALARKDKDLDYTIVRMPDFYGPFVINSFSEELYINAIKGKSLRWIGNLDAEVELIYIEDGGEAMVQAALDENSGGEVYNIPGCDITTARKYLTEITSQAGSKSKASTLNANLIFDLLGLFMPMISEVKEMLYLKREKLILDGKKFQDNIGPIPATDYQSGIGKTLDWVKDFYQLK